MTWIEIGRNHLKAAQTIADEHPRSAASRAYYAAHVVLSDALASAGCPLPPRRQTVLHREQPRLIGRHLSSKGSAFVRAARRMIRRLYDRRIAADYVRTATVDVSTARDSIRDASALFRLLGVA